jgi:hypothetical protein
MYLWSRTLETIGQLRLPDADFLRLRGRNLAETLMNCAWEPIPQCVAAADLQWLETEFQPFNVENSYPLALQPQQICSDLMPQRTPSCADSRRYQREHRRQPLRWLLDWLGLRQPTAARSRTTPRAA